MSVGFVSGNYDSLGARVALGRGLVDARARPAANWSWC